MAIGATTFVFDIEAQPEIAVRKITALGTAYDLQWVDAAYGEADAGARLADYERSRRFQHCGGAIAWARRKIFHGELFGESVEMRTVALTAINDTIPREEVTDVVDITLAGFCRWKDADTHGYGSLKGQGVILGKPERKCRAGRE